MSKINTLICFLLATFIFSGCSTTLKQYRSGFLGDYSKLKNSTEFDNAQVYTAPTFGNEELAKVEEIRLIPFEIWIETKNSTGETIINANSLSKLHDYFHLQLRKALVENNYRLVEKSGPKVLTIRGAFSDIRFTEPDSSAADLIPIKLVINASKSAYLSTKGMHDVLSQLAIEVEFIMGQNNQRVFAMTVTRAIEATVIEGNEGNYQAATQIFDIWITNFIKKLASVKGK